jgi:hypothetical protein
VRYVAEFEPLPPADPALGPAVNDDAEAPAEAKSYECVEVNYVHWKDVLWSAGSRVWHEARWLAFANDMSRAQLVKRFGALGQLVPLSAPRGEDGKKPSPWGRARVWEVWSKEERKVFWYVEGFHKVLDVVEDPLGLEAF